MKPSGNIKDLLEIMARLRDQERGCPWDVEQDFKTIAPYTIEEAYEVADAIDRGDMASLREELGDLLFQVVFHAQMAREAGNFAFQDVVEAVSAKMIRRHPHVFGNDKNIKTAAHQARAWEAAKAHERKTEKGDGGALSGVPKALPALKRAQKLQSRAGRVGFDWNDAKLVLDKIEEEIGELRHEIERKAEPERTADELGDLLFATVNLARHLGIDSEEALRRANRKFARRFRAIEQAAASKGRRLEELSLEEMERLWRGAKSQA